MLFRRSTENEGIYPRISRQAELRGPRAYSKSFLGGKDCDTRVIDFDYTLEQL